MDFVTEWQRKSTMIFRATGRPKGVELRVDLPYTGSKLIGNVQPPISAVKNQSSGILMIQAGYMYKRITEPEELNCRNVTRIYAVSNCISKNFAYYIPFWKHNQYWFFNAPEDMDGIIGQQKIIGEFELLYYELYEKEFDEEEQAWREFPAEEAFGYDVKLPEHKEFLGFDIVSYTQGNAPECSPLSCNLLCREVDVNENCLLDDFEQAIRLTETLNENKAEPGPYRIIAVHRIKQR